MHILLSVSGVDNEDVKSSFLFTLSVLRFSLQLNLTSVVSRRSNECSTYNSCYLLVVTLFCWAASEVVSVVVGVVVSSGVVVRMPT